MKRTVLAVLMAVGVLALSASAQNAPPAAPSTQPQQPPQGQQQQDDGYDQDHGVARISLLNGEVSIKRGDTGETIAAELNAPLVALDHLLTGQGSRAEIQFDWANLIRLGPESEVRIGELRDNSYLIQVAEGTTTFRVLRDSTAQVEISTPTVSVRPSQKGIYRVTVRPDGMTEITVRSGQAEIFTPRGSEILSSGKTMEARGTAADPEYMINNAIASDDWDTWNENRDRDLLRTQSYQYTSHDQTGADDLDAYGRWVYDAPYGNVWVPNVASTWAPYRVGRWSWINYYGWTWVSGDPWGWAPYHYGNWYSSPYGWAWYPGAIGPRYYWRPAVVGFFGWGGGGFGVGVGFGGGWGFGNVGWVPLAPYEIYRPWYGRGYGYGYGNTRINNTIINNTNITNVYRNARNYNGRNGVTGMQANNFGRQAVNGNNFVRANGRDLERAGQVQGAMPFQQSRESRQFSNNSPGADTSARAGRQQNTQFANFARNSQGAGGQGSNGQNANRQNGFARANQNNGNKNGFSQGSNARQNGVFADRGATATPQNNSQQNNGQAGGWRRFDPSTSANRSNGTVDRGSNVRGVTANGGNGNVGAGANASGAAQQSQQYSGSGFRQQSSNGRTFSNSGTLNGQATQQGAGRNFNPVQINPPIVRNRGYSSSPNTNTNSAPRYATPSPSYNNGGGMRSAPQVQSAPRSSAPSYSGGGGTRSFGGGGGAAPRASAPSGGGGGMRSGGGGGSHGGGGGGGGHRR